MRFYVRCDGFEGSAAFRHAKSVEDAHKVATEWMIDLVRAGDMRLLPFEITVVPEANVANPDLDETPVVLMTLWLDLERREVLERIIADRKKKCEASKRSRDKRNARWRASAEEESRKRQEERERRHREANERQRRSYEAPPRNTRMGVMEAYAILGVTPYCHNDVAKRAWKQLIVANHPDKGGSLARAMEINAAWDVVKGRTS